MTKMSENVTNATLPLNRKTKDVGKHIVNNDMKFSPPKTVFLFFHKTPNCSNIKFLKL